MFEPDKITRNGGHSNGSAQKDTPLREAGKPLMLQGKMWVIASSPTRLQARSRKRRCGRCFAITGCRVRRGSIVPPIRITPGRDERAQNETALPSDCDFDGVTA